MNKTVFLDTELSSFPIITSKYDLINRYKVSYRQLKRMFTPEVLQKINYEKKRKFTPQETYLIFMHLEPERFSLYQEKMTYLM